MNRDLSLCLACGFLLFASGYARADKEAEKLVEDAIKAHGGADNLARVRQAVRTASGVVRLAGQEFRLSDEMQMDLPERFRHELTLREGPRLLIVISGKNAWEVVGGATLDMTRQRLTECREEMHLLYVIGLAPLRSDKRFDLTSVKDEEVDGQKVAGVKVSCRGEDDIRLYFDKKTGLLVKASRKARLAGLTVDKDYLFSEYKEFDGAKLATKFVELLNNNKTTEITSASYKFPKKVDEKAFAKP